MKIGPVKVPKTGHNKWCGPAAISIIAHVTTAQAAKLLREITGRKQITATWHGEVLRALRRLGYTNRGVMVSFNPNGRMPTVAQWLRESAKVRGKGIFLVSTTSHWIVVQGRKGADNHSKVPVPLKQMKGRRQRIDAVFEVHKAKPYPGTDARRFDHVRTL